MNDKEYIKKVCSKCANIYNENDLCNIVRTMDGNYRCSNEKIKKEIIDALMNETAVEIEISKIKIPEHFSKPNPKKLQQKFKYYKENHKFESQIVIDLDYNLIDGYTSYLIAKNYNKTTVIAKLKRNKEMEGK